MSVGFFCLRFCIAVVMFSLVPLEIGAYLYTRTKKEFFAFRSFIFCTKIVLKIPNSHKYTNVQVSVFFFLLPFRFPLPLQSLSLFDIFFVFCVFFLRLLFSYSHNCWMPQKFVLLRILQISTTFLKRSGLKREKNFLFSLILSLPYMTVSEKGRWKLAATIEWNWTNLYYTCTST